MNLGQVGSWQPGCVHSVGYFRQVDGCLQWDVNMRQVGSWQPVCVYSVSYFRQVDGFLQWGCELETGWQLVARVCVLRQLL